MIIFTIINELARKRGENVKAIALELGFSENLFYRWKETQPKAADLAKVADYFHVSVDYLLGREKVEYKESDLAVMIDNAFNYKGYKVELSDKIFIEKFLETYFEMNNRS